MRMESKLLYQKIKSKIMDEIKQMEPHARIPSRVKLAEKYKVNRTTIERAISELLGEGYLYAKDGSGTYVADLTANKKESVINQWGVIIPNIMHDTYPEILRGIEDVASSENINVLVCNTDNQAKKQNNYIKNLINTKVDGIIIVPAVLEEGDMSVFQELNEHDIPFVACNRSIPGIQSPKVISNNYYGGFLATRHLLEQGFKKIAFIANIYYTTSIERYEGYIAALSEAGLEVNEEHVIFEDYSAQYIDLNKVKNVGYKNASKLLSGTDRPDAFFCFDDLIAQGVYYAIKEKGYKIGQDIGLVGYNNNYYICKSLPGQLTSVDFKSYSVGKQAAEILLDVLHGKKLKKNKTIVIQPELKVRGSSMRQYISLKRNI